MTGKVVRSHYPSIDIPTNVSLPEFILGRAEVYGDKLAIVHIFPFFCVKLAIALLCPVTGI